MLSMLPLAHLFELTGGLLAPLACGARIVYERSPLPNRIICSIRDEGITHALAVPGLVECLIDEVRSEWVDGAIGDEKTGGKALVEAKAGVTESGEKSDLARSIRAVIGPSFHTLIVGGASLGTDLVEILKNVGIQIEVGYGLTEASPIVSLGLMNEDPVGSVGRPLPGVVVRISREGEILVRGDNVMRGYFQDPEATREVLVDGWLRTGDRGLFDEEGFLFLTGRLKDAIVTSSGETLEPQEMETHYRHSRFAEICIAGIREADGNDLPVLFVFPADEAMTDEECREAFRSLRTAAPSRLRASRVVRLSQPLPRTPTGKVRRAELIRFHLATLRGE